MLVESGKSSNAPDGGGRLKRVVAVWPSCVDVLPDDPHEDTITENLLTPFAPNGCRGAAR